MDVDRWDPWRLLEEARQEADRRFRAVFQQLAEERKEREPIEFSPIVDAFVAPRGLVVKLGLPGLIQEDIDIFVDAGVLTVRGERQPPADAAPEAYLLHEWPYGRFERSIILPFAVDKDRIQATYADGVLIIVLPRG